MARLLPLQHAGVSFATWIPHTANCDSTLFVLGGYSETQGRGWASEKSFQRDQTVLRRSPPGPGGVSERDAPHVVPRDSLIAYC
jgi:hypothetical protein